MNLSLLPSNMVTSTLWIEGKDDSLTLVYKISL